MKEMLLWCLGDKINIVTFRNHDTVSRLTLLQLYNNQRTWIVRQFKTTSMHLQSYFWSINPKRKINENGYVEIYSLKQAEKIAAITQRWESMISNFQSPKKTALILALHRIAKRRKGTNLLHRSGMRTSYTCSTIDKYMRKRCYTKLQDDIKEAIQ